MCGIAGIVGIPVLPDMLTSMKDAMRHRGPDGDGVFLDDLIGLAFTRLAIVDLAGGHQPMEDADQQVVVVFNGEIYNHRELRSQLEKAGRTFATDHSDTEVLVHGWLEWGEGLVDRLNGMFAFAIWDRRNRQLVLARDRFGIKPLYIASIDKGGGLSSPQRSEPFWRVAWLNAFRASLRFSSTSVFRISGVPKPCSTELSRSLREPS